MATTQQHRVLLCICDLITKPEAALLLVICPFQVLHRGQLFSGKSEVPGMPCVTAVHQIGTCWGGQLYLES